MPLDLKTLAARHDASSMAKVIEGMAAQIDYALRDTTVPALTPKYERAVVLGMGGSALPADVVKDAFYDTLAGERLVSWRRYGRPPVGGGSKTLFIASSFSGNTEETLDGVEALRKSDGQDLVIVAAGGALLDIARRDGLRFVHITAEEREPRGFQPRCATGYFVGYLVRILESAGLLTGAVEQLERVPQFLHQQCRAIRDEAERCAASLADRIAVVLTDDCYERSIGRIATIKIEENAKRPALYAALPEANHNLMIGLSRPDGMLGGQGPSAGLGFLYLSDPASDSRLDRRFDVMRDVFAGDAYRHVSFRSWSLPGASRIEKIFAGLMFADWLSYTLALLDGLDPTPVALLEDFKTQLAKRRA